MDKMTWLEATDIVNKLADHFQMPRPHIRMAGRGSAAFYRRNEIRLGTGHGIIDSNRTSVLLHEFAHFLDHFRGTWTRKDKHGKPFFDALRDVATFWYGSADQYPWHADYYRVFQFAQNLGLSKRPHHRKMVTQGFKLVQIGDRVSFSHRERNYTGTVQNVRGGGRARIVVDGDAPGRFWRVCQAHLSVEV